MRYFLSWHSVAIAFGILAYAVTTIAMGQKRHPSAAIAWLLAIVLVPYLSLPLFFMFGTRKLPTARRTRDLAARPPLPGATPLDTLCNALDLPPPETYDDFLAHENGHEARDGLWRLVDGASESLEICTYIFASDTLGAALADRLAAAAARGVRVRVLVDAVGALGHGRVLRRLARAGVAVARFGRPLSLFRGSHANLRNHRKYAVADGSRVWAGGRNLAAEYFEGSPGRPAWRDLTFEMTGRFARNFVAVFDADWALASNAAHAPPGAAPVETPCVPEKTARIIPSGPDRPDDTWHAVLVSAISAARLRVAVFTPYFVPDPAVLDALVLAAKRGVTVELFLPVRSNHRLADAARTRALREMLAAGARVECVPAMNHAKAVLVDDGLALVGSANLDARSLFLNFEIMIALREPVYVYAIEHSLRNLARDARPYVPPQPAWWRAFVDGLVLWVAFQL
ncbi:MAG: cardiolipin synthase [Betaproteobacteria bacterium]|nr:cardiolipin synthase [Betaproteobacteria bacterium]